MTPFYVKHRDHSQHVSFFSQPCRAKPGRYVVVDTLSDKSEGHLFLAYSVDGNEEEKSSWAKLPLGCTRFDGFFENCMMCGGPKEDK